jgi:hypothetical protein
MRCSGREGVHRCTAEPLSVGDRVTALASAKGSRRGFAGAKPRAQSLDGYLDLQRRVEDPRIRRAAPCTKRLVVHQFRVSAPEQLDEEFAGWVREAYQVGQGGQSGRQPKA